MPGMWMRGATSPTCAYRDFQISILAGLSIDNQSRSGGDDRPAYSQSLSATLITATNPRAGNPANNVAWSLNSGHVAARYRAFGGRRPHRAHQRRRAAFQFVVKAQRDTTQVDTETLSITVRQPLVITAPKPFAASPIATQWEVGVPFSAKLVGAGGTGTFTWSIASGSLPTGFALAADGTVAGTTRTPGAFRATLRATDTEGRTADYAANLLVAQRLTVTHVGPRSPGRSAACIARRLQPRAACRRRCGNSRRARCLAASASTARWASSAGRRRRPARTGSVPDHRRPQGRRASRRFASPSSTPEQQLVNGTRTFVVEDSS